MRYLHPIGFLTAAVLLLPSTATAQRPRLKIDKVKVGFPAEPQPGEFKSGAWTPVYIDIVAPPDGIPVPGQVHVECNDTDDVRNSYAVRLAPMEPNERVSILTYTRPGNMHGDLTVHVKLEGQTQTYTHKENFSSTGIGHVLYVVAGARLGGFRRALGTEFKQSQAAQDQGGDEEDAFARDTGPRRIAFMDDVRQMPTRWFAYECVDVLFLTTGNRDFVNALLSDQENRREALAEWVRRGGRLVISTGRNQDMLANLGPALQPLLPADVTGKVELNRLVALERVAPLASHFVSTRPRNQPNAAPIEVARLVPKPGKQAEGFMEEQKDLPLLVKGTHGLGRVAVVAFDLDSPPFTTWNGQPQVWKKLRTEMQREQLPQGQETQGRGTMVGLGGQDGNESLSILQRSLEDFEDVPVISFGWVALFILVYILIVGPLDYFFLKKVVKRLELTWITFPTVVVAISVAAYFTAYHLKGNDQKINKVDLVDIDLQGQQAFGQTWFTIFSPRIQHYNIGIEPVNPEWAPPAAGDANRTYSIVMSWMGRPEQGWGGAGRSGSQSLFRRTYEYEPDAVALKGVPIQVWTTKSFLGSWETPLDANRPLFSADLRQPSKRPDQLTGTITSGLPVHLEDVYLYHNRGDGGKWYSIGQLLPNNPQRVDGVLRGEGQSTPQWLEQRAAVRAGNTPRRGPYAVSEAPQDVLKLALFHMAELRGGRRNTGLRFLEQSHRLSRTDELVLFGRVVRQEGDAEDVTQNLASPTRLWLRDLPGPKKTRAAVPGTMNQETFVRIFLPVRTVNPE